MYQLINVESQLTNISDVSNNILDASNTFFVGNNQQPYNFYILNNAAYNFVFECTPLDVSSNYNIIPRFIDYFNSAGIGFSDVSSTATIDIPASILNNIFMFQQRNLQALIDIDGLDELVYGVNQAQFNIKFSEAKVRRIYNGDVSMVTLAYDYVEAIAETITNSVSTSPQSIITNITQLKNGIGALDAGFCIKLNDRLNMDYDASLSYVDSTGQPKPTLNSFKTPNSMDIACKNLISGLLNFTTPERINLFFQDISAQEISNKLLNRPALYSFVFHTGDVVAVKLIYKPKFILFNLDNRQIIFSDRSYKIFLKVI
jgi:hypothetical protein